MNVHYWEVDLSLPAQATSQYNGGIIFGKSVKNHIF